MGKYRPIPTTCWEKFLKSHGCSFARISASHHVWKCHGCIRSIIFRGAEKEIPPIHLKTCLFTIGKSIDYLMDWTKENC